MDPFQLFREICDELVNLSKSLDDHLVENAVVAEGMGILIQIDSLLEKLYDCEWGDGESLKKIVVTIQSQLNNVEWTGEHVRFAKVIFATIRARRVVNDDLAKECMEIVKEHGLDIFRGTVSGDVERRFVLVPADES